MPVFAHPTDLTGRIADNQSVWRNIFSDHGPCADHSIFADRMAANDRCIRTNRSSFADMCFQILVLRETALRGLTTFVKTQLGPKKTSSPQVTPV